MSGHTVSPVEVDITVQKYQLNNTVADYEVVNQSRHPQKNAAPKNQAGYHVTIANSSPRCGNTKASLFCEMLLESYKPHTTYLQFQSSYNSWRRDNCCLVLDGLPRTTPELPCTSHCSWTCGRPRSTTCIPRSRYCSHMLCICYSSSTAPSRISPKCSVAPTAG